MMKREREEVREMSEREMEKDDREKDGGDRRASSELI